MNREKNPNREAQALRQPDHTVTSVVASWSIRDHERDVAEVYLALKAGHMRAGLRVLGQRPDGRIHWDEDIELPLDVIDDLVIALRSAQATCTRSDFIEPKRQRS